MDGERIELLDHGAAFVVVHAQHVFGMVAEEQAFTARVGVGAHDGMVDWRNRFALGFGHRHFAVPAGARKIQVMHGAQVRDRAFPVGAQALIGAVHVAEMRFAAFAGGDFRKNDGGLSGDAFPRTVGMPGQRALVGMAAVGIAVLVEIG